MIVVLTGARNSGKTHAAAAFAASCRVAGWAVRGCLQWGRTDAGGQKTGYDLEDLASGTRAPWLTPARSAAGASGGTAWAVTDAGARLAARALRAADPALWIVDELGPFELRGAGHAPHLAWLHTAPAADALLVVRQGLVGAVLARFQLRATAILASGAPAAALSAALAALFARRA